MEELRNENTMMETETTNENLAPENGYVPETEESKGGFTLIVISGLLLAAAVAGIGIGKKKLGEKLEERQLRKLLKEGYTIIPPGEGEDEEDIVDVDSVEIEEEKGKKSK